MSRQVAQLPFLRCSFLIGLMITVIACQRQALSAYEELSYPVSVELTTTKGIITIQLSDLTPIHRENFVKNVRDGSYNHLTFHRVIDEFMIQAGKYDSLTTSRLDSIQIAELDHYIPAEFTPSLFHKRGALCAARDGNPERASSSLQFYIVQAGPLPDSIITHGESRINDWLHQHYFIHEPGNEHWQEKIDNVSSLEEFMAVTDSIKSLSKVYDYDRYEIPSSHREVYRTIGGTPHLDQNYTVFGAVTSGMSIVDAIAQVATDEAGRPDEVIYILKARIIN